MTPQTTCIRCFIILAFTIAISAEIFSQTQAQWRGDDRRGIYPETSAITDWAKDGPKLLWSTEGVGDGYGSPVFLDGKLYICGALDSTAYLFVYDLTGKLIRKAPFGKEWVINYAGSRMAPTIADGLIYLSTGMGSLVCLDLTTLAEKWRVEGNAGFHNVLPLFGHSESPAIDGDLIFFTPGGKDTNVVALNRFTGKIVWICNGNGERPGYNSPLVIKLMTRSVLVTFTAYSLMGIDTKTGKLLWTHPQNNIPLPERKPGNGDTHSNTVWYDNGTLYYIAGDGNGAVKLNLSFDGSSISEVWRNKAIDNYMGGFIKMGNLIYSGSDSKKSFYSLNIATGEVTDTLKCGIGALISDGKMLYYYNQRGEMNLIRQGIPGMELISKFKVIMGTKEHFAHPVINKGVLYIRHGKALMAYDIAGK